MKRKCSALSGWLAVVVVLLVGAAAMWTMASFDTVRDGLDWIKVAAVAILVLAGVSLAGLTVVNPERSVRRDPVRRLQGDAQTQRILVGQPA